MSDFDCTVSMDGSCSQSREVARLRARIAELEKSVREENGKAHDIAQAANEWKQRAERAEAERDQWKAEAVEMAEAVIETNEAYIEISGFNIPYTGTAKARAILSGMLEGGE